MGSRPNDNCPIRNAWNEARNASPLGKDMWSDIHGFERIKKKSLPITKDVSD